TTPLYPDFQAWESHYSKLKATPDPLAPFRSTLCQGPEQVRKSLETLFQTERDIVKLYTYAHLRHDKDIAADQPKQAYQRALGLLHMFNEQTAWFEPEMLSLSEATWSTYLQSEVLKPYQHHLEKIYRMKPHTLSADQELLLAAAGRSLQATHLAFSALNDADLNFGQVKDNTGNIHELTHGSFSMFLQSYDRTLRKNAFQNMLKTYQKHENTLCELLHGQTQKHLFHARTRHFSSCLEASLYPHQIDFSVYRNLIETVNANLSTLHRYMELRKQLLNVNTLHLWDMHVPLTQQQERTYSYATAEELVIASVAPLGASYQESLRKGLQQERWVDRFENQNKRSGAYSSGCFDSHPYILMNYKGNLRDVFTLAHEAGHSMHTAHSCTHQPYHFSSYPIFLAEVASTFNEDLLTRHLLATTQDPNEKLYILNQKIDDLRSTFFRQAMFAEFELWLHETAENSTPITPELINATYLELNRKYFGPTVSIDAEIAHEWARIPHFYYNFYVYQYATGVSAALCLSDRVMNGGQTERDAYLSFLSGGSSQPPLTLLKQAGVDLSTPAPIEAMIGTFNSLVSEFEEVSKISSQVI
ncbi:MAG: oligoendopeptidase F, partial [Chlamydiia bacterium]|nr:oligoendopeptidase F [Chlamydiia bacterium]